MQFNPKYATPVSNTVNSGVRNKVLKNTYLMLSLIHDSDYSRVSHWHRYQFLIPGTIPNCGFTRNAGGNDRFNVCRQRYTQQYVGNHSAFPVYLCCRLVVRSLASVRTPFQNGSQLIGLAAAGTGIIFSRLPV